jgi:hypothetical protein
VKFDYSGFEQVNAVAIVMGDNRLKTLIAADALVRSSGFAIVGWAQRFAAVDTGTMRSSVGVDFRRWPGGYEATAGPTVEYAPPVEYGTSRQAPQAFMGPALDRVSGAFLAAAEAMADPLRVGGVSQGVIPS